MSTTNDQSYAPDACLDVPLAEHDTSANPYDPALVHKVSRILKNKTVSTKVKRAMSLQAGFKRESWDTRNPHNRTTALALFDTLGALFDHTIVGHPNRFVMQIPSMIQDIGYVRRQNGAAYQADENRQFTDKFLGFVGKNEATFKNIQKQQSKQGRYYYLDGLLTSILSLDDSPYANNATGNFILQHPGLWLDEAKSERDFHMVGVALQMKMKYADGIQPAMVYKKNNVELWQKGKDCVLTDERPGPYSLKTIHKLNGDDLSSSIIQIHGPMQRSTMVIQQKI